MYKLGILLGLVLIFPLTAGAQIYKWKDTNGVIRYSDLPPPAAVPFESMQGKKPAKAVKQPEAEAEKVPSEAKAKVSPGNDQAEAKRKQAEKVIKEDNCKAAKTNMQNLAEANVYRLDNDGNQKFLTDAEIAKERERSQQEIDKNCN